MRYAGVQQGTDQTPLARSVAEGLDTRILMTSVHLDGDYRLARAFALQLGLAVEDRDLLNQAFPPEGRGGERRHDEVRGVGDTVVAARFFWHGPGAVPAVVGSLAAGVLLPTGPVRKDPLVGPTDATLQLGLGVFAPTATADVATRLGSPRRWLTADLWLLAPLYANTYGYRTGRQLATRVFYEQDLGEDGAWRLRGGLGASHSGPDARRGLEVQNSGNTTVSAHLAARLPLGKALAAQLEARVPVWLDVRGVQLVLQGEVYVALAWTHAGPKHAEDWFKD